jgi:hypothetical protein
MAIPVPSAPEGVALLIAEAPLAEVPAPYAAMQQIRRWTVNQPSMSGRTLVAYRLEQKDPDAGQL